MKLLLDTHTFIWWDSEPVRISSRALAMYQDAENTLLLSVASTWEMQIKMQLGKLKLNLPLAELIRIQQRINNLTPMSIACVVEATAVDREAEEILADPEVRS